MDSKRCYHVMVWFVVLRLTTMRLAAMTLVAARFACAVLHEGARAHELCEAARVHGFVKQRALV